MKSQKSKTTLFPPKIKPVLIWDGNCGFCNYWRIHWEKISNGKIAFLKLQESANVFPDIDPEIFRNSVCLIDLSGKVHEGAAAVFKSYELMNKHLFLNQLYLNSLFFKKCSDKVYRFVANHRAELLQATYLMFGKNPWRLKVYWIIWLLLPLVFLLLAMCFL